MKKQLLTSLLLIALFAPIVANSAPTNSLTSCRTSSDEGTIDQPTSCPLKVLNQEEYTRFYKARADAIAADPSLAKPKNRRKLFRAIVKADPRIRPILLKLRSRCHIMQKGCASCKDSCVN